MNYFEVIVPQLGVNDKEVTVVEWRAAPGDRVQRGQVLGSVETTKAAFDLEAEQDGYFYPLAAPGERVSIRSAAALLLETPDAEAAARHAESHKAAAPQADSGGVQLTKKAQTLAEAHGLDLSTLPQGRILREVDLAPFIGAPSKTAAPAAIADDPAASHRVAIFGASQGGLAVAECLLAGGQHAPAAYLDDDPARIGTEYHGLPILPGNGLAALREQGITAVATHIALGSRRLALREALHAAGLVYLNVIHPRATVAASVAMGVGNLIKAGAVIDTDVQLGDCCIIDNGVILPHHNRIGDGCHLAPGACFGGDCSVGECSVIGIGATISARISIGAHALIGPGAIVVRDIPPHAVVEGQPARVVGTRK